jgi:hypothetical protein
MAIAAIYLRKKLFLFVIVHEKASDPGSAENWPGPDIILTASEPCSFDKLQ